MTREPQSDHWFKFKKKKKNNNNQPLIVWSYTLIISKIVNLKKKTIFHLDLENAILLNIEEKNIKKLGKKSSRKDIKKEKVERFDKLDKLPAHVAKLIKEIKESDRK